MNENYKFAKFIRINNKYKAYNDEKEIIKLYEKEVNNLQSKINKINEIVKEIELEPAYLDCKYYELDGFKKIKNIIEEN